MGDGFAVSYVSLEQNLDPPLRTGSDQAQRRNRRDGKGGAMATLNVLEPDKARRQSDEIEE